MTDYLPFASMSPDVNYQLKMKKGERPFDSLRLLRTGGIPKRARRFAPCLEARLAFGVSNLALPLRVRRVLIPFGYYWLVGF
jgi:hypothetical protein